MLLKRSAIAGLLFLFAVLQLSGQKDQTKLTHLFALKSRADFDLLKGEPLTNNFNGIECVKLIYVLETKKLYYLESKRYRWHYRFAQEILQDPDDLEQFNIANYGNNSSRKYILATFNYNVNSKNYFLQFSVSDNPSDALIEELVSKVSSSFFKEKQFKILLNSTILLRRKKTLSEKYSILTSDEIFKNQTYQPIYKGKTKGILKFINADSLKQNKNYDNCIIILKGNSNEIPVCKGIITTEFQTPLSHICLLTNNRRTPAAAHKTIFSVDSLRKWENTPVELIIGEERLRINKIKEGITATNKPQKSRSLNSDTTTAEIANLDKLSWGKRSVYGSKVCNLAELKKIERTKGNIKTPEPAYGIPFSYYLEHIKKSGAYALIKDLQTGGQKNDSIIDKQLKKIRELIKKTPIDKTLLSIITDLCTQNFGNKKIRFRSSSNCEDESNFNGAGLYTSATGIVNDTGKTIEKAIKKVWASLWSNRAFKERSYFNFDHSTVYMGVLIHQAFDNEIVNGVAITKNLYRNYDFGFVINMQKGEEEVVSPKPGMICEQVVSYMNNSYADFYNTNRSADWISFSSLKSDGSLITSEELFQLSKQLETIKRHFYNTYKAWPKIEYKNFGLDVEFKLIELENGKRQFIFKQARPYNL